MVNEENNIKKDKVISVRLANSNLQLFNELNITPTQLVNFALKEYSEKRMSPKKALILAYIHETNLDIEYHKLELAAKKGTLARLTKELANVEKYEYNTQRDNLMPIIEERYYDEIRNPDSIVDCVESFFEQRKDFLEIQQNFYSITDENMEKILDEFYNMQANNIEFDKMKSNRKVKDIL